jgi:2-octaprenyl-6-methoxyphenol hydroxylase
MRRAVVDVVIRGAGPIGRALAIALRHRGLEVVLVGSHSSPAFRPIVLSYASRLILERLGVWQAVPATPIETIQVSQQRGFGRVRLEAREMGVAALGYVTEYASLLKALDCEVHAGDEPQARCVVHAEGMAPDAGEKRYAQDALVALVSFAPPPATTAFERFTPEGPLALLPIMHRYALVWSCTPQRAAQLAAMPGEEFAHELAAAAGRAPGRPLSVESRAVQPLMLRVRSTRVGPRAVYIGNAAQTLHPVAGQGLNLGLRDAWDLATAWLEAPDPGDPAVLARYASSRRLDAAATIRTTDMLASAFVGSSRVLRVARGAAMTALDVLPGPRRFFARRMIFGARALP